MIGIITGDIIKSRKHSTKLWFGKFKKLLEQFGSRPKNWDIYRGDEFQIEIKNPQDTLISAIKIKALFRSIQNLNVRLSIGIGSKTHNADRITESNGSAFVYSGEKFEELKKQKVTLGIKTGNDDFDEKINLMLRLALISIDQWSTVSAQQVFLFTNSPEKSQLELAKKLKIKQSAISQRLSRANYDDIILLEKYFRNAVKKELL
jgi:hypothetical protein